MPMIHPQRGGVDGIKDTLSHMQRMVNRVFTSEVIRMQAASAIQHCSSHDKTCQCASLLAWVQRKMVFIRDPSGVEALHDPLAVANVIQRGGRPFGDCDDFSMYLAALMKSVGLPATFRAVGYMGKNLAHVYVVGPQGMQLDATRNVWSPQLGESLPETSSLNWSV
jgi:hypothetical protein